MKKKTIKIKRTKNQISDKSKVKRAEIDDKNNYGGSSQQPIIPIKPPYSAVLNRQQNMLDNLNLIFDKNLSIS